MFQKNGQTEKDLEFQRELQILFVKNNRKKYDEIVKALEADDVKLAHRLAHTLKGSAGQIGITGLQQAAADVEQQLKGGQNLVTQEQMTMLETELAAVLSQFEAQLSAQLEAQFETKFSTELGSLLDGPSQQEEEAQIDFYREWLDAEFSRGLFDKLWPMLEMGNPECREFIDSLRLVPGSEKLIQQMEDFDFEQAIVTLAELKKRV